MAGQQRRAPLDTDDRARRASRAPRTFPETAWRTAASRRRASPRPGLASTRVSGGLGPSRGRRAPSRWSRHSRDLVLAELQRVAERERGSSSRVRDLSGAPWPRRDPRNFHRAVRLEDDPLDGFDGPDISRIGRLGGFGFLRLDRCRSAQLAESECRPALAGCSGGLGMLGRLGSGLDFYAPFSAARPSGVPSELRL